MVYIVYKEQLQRSIIQGKSFFFFQIYFSWFSGLIEEMCRGAVLCILPIDPITPVLRYAVAVLIKVPVKNSAYCVLIPLLCFKKKNHGGNIYLPIFSFSCFKVNLSWENHRTIIAEHASFLAFMPTTGPYVPSLWHKTSTHIRKVREKSEILIRLCYR